MDEKIKAKLICCGNLTPGMDGKLLSFLYKSELTVFRRDN